MAEVVARAGLAAWRNIYRINRARRYHHVDPIIRLHGRGSVEMPWKNNRYTNILHKWWNGVNDHK